MSWDDDDYGSSSSSSSRDDDRSSSSSSSSSRDDDDYRPSRSSSSSSSSSNSNKSRDDDDDYFVKSIDDPLNILGGVLNKKSNVSGNSGKSSSSVTKTNGGSSGGGRSGSVNYTKVVEPVVEVVLFDLFTYDSIKQLAVSTEDINLVNGLNELYNDKYTHPIGLDKKILETFHSNLALYEALLDIDESRNIILNNDYYVEEGYGIGIQMYTIHYDNSTYLLDYVREYLIYHSTYIDEIGYSSGATDSIDSFGPINSPYFDKDSIEGIYTDYIYWW